MRNSRRDSSMSGSAESVREPAPTLTPALSLSEGEGVIPIPSPPEGERVRVRGSAGRGHGVHESLLSGRVFAQVETSYAVGGAELGGGAVESVLAEVEHEDAVGHGENRLDVLLDDEEGEAVTVQRLERRVDFVDDVRGQRRRRLIEEEEAGVGDEGPRDGEEPLLSSGEAARELAAPVAEDGKASVDLIDGLALGGARDRVAAEHEIVLHGHLREEPSRLGQVADPEAHDLVGPAPRDVAAVEDDAARGGREIAERGLEQGGLARAVGPDDAHDRPVRDLEGGRLNDLELAVAGAHRFKLELDGLRAPPAPRVPHFQGGPRSRADRHESLPAALPRSSCRDPSPRSCRRAPSRTACGAR